MRYCKSIHVDVQQVSRHSTNLNFMWMPRIRRHICNLLNESNPKQIQTSTQNQDIKALATWSLDCTDNRMLWHRNRMHLRHNGTFSKPCNRGYTHMAAHPKQRSENDANIVGLHFKPHLSIWRAGSQRNKKLQLCLCTKIALPAENIFIGQAYRAA